MACHTFKSKASTLSTRESYGAFIQHTQCFIGLSDDKNPEYSFTVQIQRLWYETLVKALSSVRD